LSRPWLEARHGLSQRAARAQDLGDRFFEEQDALLGFVEAGRSVVGLETVRGDGAEET
jgi:hypothetical protein